MYMDKLKKRFLSLHELDEYSLRNSIEKSKPFCIHLKDDSGSVNNFLMTVAHEYKHFSDCSDEIIENSALSLLIYITRLYEKTLKNEIVTTTKNEIIDDLIKYMVSNKTECALKIFDTEETICFPEYIEEAINEQ